MVSNAEQDLGRTAHAILIDLREKVPNIPIDRANGYGLASTYHMPSLSEVKNLGITPWLLSNPSLPL